MPVSRKWRRPGGLLTQVILLALVVVLGQGGSTANAADPPDLGQAWASSVFSGSARLHAEVNPNGLATFYHLDYISRAAHDANVGAGKDAFTGAVRIPSAFDASVGSGSSWVVAVQQVSSLLSDTAYRYRVVARNSAGTVTGPTLSFVTQRTGGSALPDGRGWEMVSPVDKNGGQVDAPGALAGGGVLQAAADGQSITYGSSASFGPGAQGAPPASQYIARRRSGGWSSENITAPLFSGSYGLGDEGVPYQLFSQDLSRGLLLSGRHCRGEHEGCPVANPPLPGTDAPAGYQNYYLRESGAAAFEALLGTADVADLELDPAQFSLRFAGASPDLRHVALTTCAALAPDAVEEPLGDGCDPAEPNLYLWSAGAGLALVNVLPAQSQGTPGAALGAQSAAVAAGGGRIYWKSLAGVLYLREGGQTRQVDLAVGGGGTFETASSDGSTAFYTKAGHLYRYDALARASVDLTPSGGVAGVLGASADASHVYYLTGSGLFLRQGGTTTEVAETADASNHPPATGTARVSAAGTRLVFVSTVPLTGYDNTGLNSETPESQVYLYDAPSDALACVSCNPTNARPVGRSWIPGSAANGVGPGVTDSYKSRVLSADGRRVFFNSLDAIAAGDTNAGSDVYQWEAQGTGSCTRASGCVDLISSGRDERGATLVDASADGSDVFFLTDRSLVGSDLPGSVDLYDARVGGGFPEPTVPIACAADACQFLPPPPVDPTVTTLLPGPGNSPVRFAKAKGRCKKKGFVRRKGKCVRKKTSKRAAKGRRSR